MVNRLALLGATCLALAGLGGTAQASVGRHAVKVPLVAVCGGVSARNEARLTKVRHVTHRGLVQFCKHYGRPVKPVAHTDTTLCLNVGCAWILLLNQGGGWGFAEYGLDPYGFAVRYGVLSIVRYNHKTRKTSGWTDNTVTDNCGIGYCGYRNQYPGKGLNTDTMTGWAALSNGVVADCGPVAASATIT